MKTGAIPLSTGGSSFPPVDVNPHHSLKEVNHQLNTSLSQMMSKAHADHAAHAKEHRKHAKHSKHATHHSHSKHSPHSPHAVHATHPSNPAPAAHPSSTQHVVQRSTASTGGSHSSTGPVSGATSVSQASSTTHPRFLPVIRGDEAQSDAQVKNQADFGRLVDKTAKEYGLDPNVFRAQLQVESGAFTSGYQNGMHHVGDLDRAPQHNVSLGLGQISEYYLDGGPWSKGGPGDARLGGQVVTTSEYQNSVTVQVRMAAANDAMRIADHGGLPQGLAYYVSGNADPSNPSAASYLQKIDDAMRNPAVITPGR